MTSLGMNNAPISQGEFFVILGPGARVQPRDRRVLPRRRRRSYLYDRARMPAAVFRRHFEELAWAQWMKTVPDDHLLPMTGEPGNIRVLVAGGPGQAHAPRARRGA